MPDQQSRILRTRAMDFSVRDGPTHRLAPGIQQQQQQQQADDIEPEFYCLESVADVAADLQSLFLQPLDAGEQLDGPLPPTSGSMRSNCMSSGRPPTLWWLLILAASLVPDSMMSG